MFFFDTVRFIVPLNSIERREFFVNFLQKKAVICFDEKEQVKFSSQRFRFKEYFEDFNMSYSSSVSFGEHQKGIQFEFSVPKLMMGHNFNNFSDFTGFFTSFHSYLSRCCDNLFIPPYSSWLLKRIDISVNLVSDYDIDLSYILSKIAGSYQYRNLNFTSYDGCIYLPSRSHTVKFYDKAKEALSNQKYYHCENFEELQEQVENAKVLRFEEEWRAEYLMRATGALDRNGITFDVFLNFMEDYDYREHYGKYMRGFNEYVRVNSIDDIFSLISSVFTKKSKPYFEFLNKICTCGYEETKSRYKKSTFYGLRKNLLEIGINVKEFSNFIFTHTENFFDFHNFNWRLYEGVSSPSAGAEGGTK